MPKFINENGEIKEGILLTDEEVALLEDPLFTNVSVNVAIKGSYIGERQIKGFLTYIIQHFELRRRVSLIQEAEIVTESVDVEA